MEDRSSRHMRILALISMMARSKRSNQRPDTLTQDRISQVVKTSCTARPCGMIGRVEETSASFEARSAPRSYPTNPDLALITKTQCDGNLSPYTTHYANSFKCCILLNAASEAGRAEILAGEWAAIVPSAGTLFSNSSSTVAHRPRGGGQLF